MYYFASPYLAAVVVVAVAASGVGAEPACGQEGPSCLAVGWVVWAVAEVVDGASPASPARRPGPRSCGTVAHPLNKK